MYVHREKLCDMVPVDIVANSCIVAAMMAANNKPKTPFVVNCVSGSLNPISWGQVKTIADPLLIRNPSMEMFRYPGSRFHSIKQLHDLNVLIEHVIPSQLVDFVFRITGHQPILSQVYQKVHRTINALEYFTTNEWTYRTNNFQSLSASLNQADRNKFYTDVRMIHWPTYMEVFILGVRKFLLKEDPSTLPEARRRLQRIYYIILLAKLAVVGGSLQQFYYHYSTIKRYWEQLGRPLMSSTMARIKFT
ncbi:putative fatty acyl-CoA reductase [Halotydeus destructor]|nr:putative fatty acyl-CoA reductase [Halotydeus destructor]